MDLTELKASLSFRKVTLLILLILLKIFLFCFFLTYPCQQVDHGHSDSHPVFDLV